MGKKPKQFGGNILSGRGGAVEKSVLFPIKISIPSSDKKSIWKPS